MINENTIECSLRFSTENEPYPRLLYTINETGKGVRTIASPYIHMSNRHKLAYALRELANMIEQPWVNPAE